MKVLLALAVGYVAGSKSAGREIEQLAESLKALCGTDEFADVVTTARSQLASSLRGLAEAVDVQHLVPEAGGDLVARVRNLVGHS